MRRILLALAVVAGLSWLAAAAAWICQVGFPRPALDGPVCAVCDSTDCTCGEGEL